MTTNNHPANGHVSLERLHQIREILSKAAAQSDGGNIGYAMADAVKVIDGVIAAFNAELYVPTVQCWSCREVIEVSAVGDCDGYCPKCDSPIDLDEEPYDAAMLQAGNHTEQHLDMVVHSGDDNEKADCRLPFDQWLSQQNEPIDVDCGCVTTEAFYHWLRVAYEAGNSPVTPDGWQLVPKEPTAAMNKAGWDAMNEHDAINPTYRAMLASAPKQEVKAALEHGMQRYAGAMQKLSEGDD
ncbi:hypothetical protein [Citrobacter sp. Cf042]|uniref:hypothetical protein n=1 Tax=Citrobacter sp. Cf042 TaxID=2985045 RepID=UPI002582033F|nr:hypothetical protein [Citrobacter sp. Cf042]MDM3285022.1 hypothetical protein [Citrobacter sp. Cf042]